MRKVNSVVNYILKTLGDEVEQDITNLKLQKLLYYCQGYYLALRGKKLFDTPLEAWKYGPVVPVVYQNYSFAGRSCIPCPAEFDQSSLSDDEKQIIDGVLRMYGCYSASKLIEMSHSETPWATTAQGEVIPTDLISSFFIDKIYEDLPPDLEDELFDRSGVIEVDGEEW